MNQRLEIKITLLAILLSIGILIPGFADAHHADRILTNLQYQITRLTNEIAADQQYLQDNPNADDKITVQRRLDNKTKELKNMDVTVGTAHKFQGDEKDIILFSPAISKNIKQTTLDWVHTTTQLLNVAITRARSVLIIIGDKKKCYEVGGFLKDLVEYVESKKQLDVNFDSPVEDKLFKKLTKEGIKVFPQYEIKIRGKKHYRLDFALFINNNKYDIEVDGDKSHTQKIESDILRDIHLRIEGWKVRRFQAGKIYDDIDEVIKEIKRLC